MKKKIYLINNQLFICISFHKISALSCVIDFFINLYFYFSFLRPDAEKKKKSFDWTFSTDYKGTLSGNISVQETNETINYELLKQRDQILFYHDLTLFEDELHDHGISKLSVKIVSCLLFIYNIYLFFHLLFCVVTISYNIYIYYYYYYYLYLSFKP